MAVADAKHSADDARLAALTLPDGQGWAQVARKDALARLRAMRLPQRRDEYWRFTRPDTLKQAEVPEAALFDEDEPEIFGDVERLKIVFVDGVFDADAS